MTIGFILNGEDVTVKANPCERLSSMLRDSFGLLGARRGCSCGHCGSCVVFYNGEIAPSCMIPAFRVRGSEIITIEGFSQTQEYEDIRKGFTQAGVETCGYCETGKILAAEALLSRNHQPSEEEIKEGLSCVECRCTEIGSLVAGVRLSAMIRQKRIYGRGK